MAPETMVAAVAQNTNWKNHAVRVGTDVQLRDEYRSPVPAATKKPVVPRKVLPNMMPKPRI